MSKLDRYIVFYGGTEWLGLTLNNQIRVSALTNR